MAAWVRKEGVFGHSGLVVVDGGNLSARWFKAAMLIIIVDGKAVPCVG